MRLHLPEDFVALQKSDTKNRLKKLMSHRQRLPRQKRVTAVLEDNPNLPEVIPPYKDNKPPVEPKISDPVIYNALLDKVRDGHFLTVACDLVGVSYDSIIEALEKGQQGQNSLYYQFWIDYRMAEAAAEEEVATYFKKGSEVDWKCAMEFLSRRWPHRWMRRDAKLVHHEHSGVVRHEVDNKLANQILEDPNLRQQARNLLRQTDFIPEDAQDAEFTESS